ncbi:MAG TPA: Maf family protein, partial [Microthrixaceae bacterium]|nr:Maf family protein [Microthrixaceae bacterium]
AAQLMSVAGTTHSLVNGIVVVDTGTGRSVAATDIMRVTMRPFTEDEARDYVRRFEPYDCSGSYRIEDQAEMPDGKGFVTEVDGEDDSGVKGLPLPLLRRMITDLQSE